MNTDTIESLLEAAAVLLEGFKQFTSSRSMSIAITKMEEVLHRLEDVKKEKVE